MDDEMIGYVKRGQEIHVFYSEKNEVNILVEYVVNAHVRIGVCMYGLWLNIRVPRKKHICLNS